MTKMKKQQFLQLSFKIQLLGRFIDGLMIFRLIDLLLVKKFGKTAKAMEENNINQFIQDLKKKSDDYDQEILEINQRRRLILVRFWVVDFF